MNRKQWKQGYKKFGKEKIKRKKSKLVEGHAMERRVNIAKTRRETL